MPKASGQGAAEPRGRKSRTKFKISSKLYEEHALSWANVQREMRRLPKSKQNQVAWLTKARLDNITAASRDGVEWGRYKRLVDALFVVFPQLKTLGYDGLSDNPKMVPFGFRSQADQIDSAPSSSRSGVSVAVAPPKSGLAAPIAKELLPDAGPYIAPQGGEVGTPQANTINASTIEPLPGEFRDGGEELSTSDLERTSIHTVPSPSTETDDEGASADTQFEESVCVPTINRAITCSLGFFSANIAKGVALVIAISAITVLICWQVMAPRAEKLRAQLLQPDSVRGGTSVGNTDEAEHDVATEQILVDQIVAEEDFDYSSHSTPGGKLIIKPHFEVQSEKDISVFLGSEPVFFRMLDPWTIEATLPKRVDQLRLGIHIDDRRAGQIYQSKGAVEVVSQS